MLNQDVKYRVTFTAHGDVLRELVDAVHASGMLRLDASDRAIDECCGIATAIRNATPISTEVPNGTPGI